MPDFTAQFCLNLRGKFIKKAQCFCVGFQFTVIRSAEFTRGTGGGHPRKTGVKGRKIPFKRKFTDEMCKQVLRAVQMLFDHFRIALAVFCRIIISYTPASPVGHICIAVGFYINIGYIHPEGTRCRFDVYPFAVFFSQYSRRGGFADKIHRHGNVTHTLVSVLDFTQSPGLCPFMDDEQGFSGSQRGNIYLVNVIKYGQPCREIVIAISVYR